MILPAQARTILFVGNSFTFGAIRRRIITSPTRSTDLNGPSANGKTVGGVPAFFKAFTQEAGLDYTVSLETVGGKGMDYHFAEKRGDAGQAVGRGGDAWLFDARPGPSRRPRLADCRPPSK